MKMGSGPAPAKIMLVGEAYGEYEERAGEPFVGPSGQEINRMFHEAGLMRSEIYCTNVVNARPQGNNIDTWFALRQKDITGRHIPIAKRWAMPIVKEGLDSLWREIELVQPNLIIAAGNTALWALTGKTGVMKWRGSLLKLSRNYGTVTPADNPPKVIPIYHPAAILRQWDLRAITVLDLRRIKREASTREWEEPAYNFRIAPSFEETMRVLGHLQAYVSDAPTWLDFDLETRAGHIACAGISWSRLDAICIPFMCRYDRAGYFDPLQESRVVYALYKLLTHPNARVRGQNILYDCQYTFRHWHFIPRVAQDTMISHHCLFSGLPKKLDFQASMYCEKYVQWKPDKTVEKEGG